MTAIAQKLDRKLKQWQPRTAREVEKRVEEIIELADDQEVPGDGPLVERAGHTKGRLSLRLPNGNWRKELRERNWRS